MTLLEELIRPMLPDAKVSARRRSGADRQREYKARLIARLGIEEVRRREREAHRRQRAAKRAAAPSSARRQ